MSASRRPTTSPAPSSTFCRTWLNVRGDLIQFFDDNELQKLADDVMTSEGACCAKVAALLNRASAQIHGKSSACSIVALLTLLRVPAKLCPAAERIVFLDTRSFLLTNHPNDIQGSSPEIVGVLQSVNRKLQEDGSNEIPWHLVLTTVEDQTLSDGPPQCDTYLGYANQARPDLVGMYGLAVTPWCFQIQYSTPAGLAVSEELMWTVHFGGILAYVCTLYLPRVASRDTSISLATCRDIFGPPLWDIDVGDMVYRSCTVRFVGSPWGRMTWVAEAEANEKEGPTVIKDSYRDISADCKEGDMYAILHEKGCAPGFAAIEREYAVMHRGTPITVSMEGCTRVKTRLIMKSSGLPLYKCKNIVDFFKGMYDILEAHRWMVAERKLLHRDISHGNIIVEAKDAPHIQRFTDTKRPIFINEVLHGTPAPPMARLLDMDNCARLETTQVHAAQAESDEENGPLKSCTGTPMFISRSVACGEILGDGGFMPMPTLQPDIERKYRQAYHDDGSELRAFADAHRSTHGGYVALELLASRLRAAAAFEHQPCHDAESVYWCIVAFVLPAKPLAGAVDKNNGAFNEMYACLAEHEVGDIDTRYPLIQASRWERWLHKDLAFIATLMVELSFQVRPEWALLVPPPHPLHLHEAMQRLILQHVHDWETDRVNVELDTVHCRTFTPFARRLLSPVSRHPGTPSSQNSPSNTLLGKRAHESLAGDARSKRMRKTGDDEPLGTASQAAPDAPELLEYEGEGENTSGL